MGSRRLHTAIIWVIATPIEAGAARIEPLRQPRGFLRVNRVHGERSRQVEGNERLGGNPDSGPEEAAEAAVPAAKPAPAPMAQPAPRPTAQPMMVPMIPPPTALPTVWPALFGPFTLNRSVVSG